MWRPTSSPEPSGNTRLASTCLALSSDHGGQSSPRRRAPIPSSSAARGRIFCGVAFSCPLDGGLRSEDKLYRMPSAALPGTVRHVLDLALHAVIGLRCMLVFHLSRTFLQLRRQHAQPKPRPFVREGAGKLAIPCGRTRRLRMSSLTAARSNTTSTWCIGRGGR